MADVDLEAFKHWNPDAQRRALDMRNAQETNWRPFYCPRDGCNGKPHGEWKWPHARADQRPPKGDFFVWGQIGGRGAGKTRTGTEWVIRHAKARPGIRVGLIGATGVDIRDTIVEGDSGILAKSPPGFYPKWEPSKKRLTWPNGSKAYGFSGEEPDRLRGPQHHIVWIDEAPHMPLIEDVWSNLLFGLRLGKRP